MANLGDKSYTYAYWQLPPGRIWVKTGDSTPFAAMVYPNIWGYKPDGIYYDDGMYFNTDNNGKPLDDSIALWRLPRSASFACNACFSVSSSNTLSAHYDVNVSDCDVPLAMAAVDNDSGPYGNFGRDPVQRYAYNQSNACNGVYTGVIYDIVFNAICLQGNVLIYDRATPSTVPAGKDLSNMADYIDAAPSTRDVTVIRPYLYKGTETPRNNSQQIIPAQGGHPTFSGYPLIDCLTEWPIPSGETYLKSKLENGQGWRSDKVYAPCSYQLGHTLFSTSASLNAITSQLEIGFTRPFTITQITTGAATIDSGHKISAQFYRCNYEPKYFDDVAYQWENAIFDYANEVELQNGMPLSGYAGTDRIRFYTRLKILDYKGNSKGKALELAVKHELAYIGLYFTDTVSNAQNKTLGTGDGENVYLPEIVGGVTTGRYFTGADIQNVPYARSGSVADDAFVYRPEETGSDSGDLDTHLHSDFVNGSAQWYALKDLDVYFLSQWLNTTYKPDLTQLSEDFKGVNPSDYIVSIRYYPFDVPAAAQTKALSVGGVSVEVNNVGITPALYYPEYGTNSNSYFDLGSFALQPPYIFGDFRDAYIKLLLYIPWCGFVTLDPSLFCQSPDGTYHSIKAALSIDFTTGAALGMIYRDNRLIDTINGTVGVDVPMSAVANGSYQNAIKQTEIALKNAKAQQLQAYLSTAGALAGGIVSAATGNVMGVAASAAAFAGAAGKTEQLNNTIEGLEYQLTHTAPSIGDISSASPFNNALSEQAARIFIFKPAMLPTYDAVAYGRTTGYACCKQGTLSQFSGFTVCADVDLSGFDAPAHHKAAIKQALQKGVYL